jgi:NADPH:quinone reductase-like Zn-dependent oxidoreductase
MKAVQLAEHGGPEIVEYADVPEPTVGRDEGRVDVKAAALDHLDVRTRRGRHPPRLATHAGQRRGGRRPRGLRNGRRARQ